MERSPPSWDFHKFLYTYNGFGITAWATNRHSVTREHDQETGLYYYRARYYDTSTGRFLSEDPIRSGMNFYQYSHNSPTNLVDPFGLKDDASPWQVGVEWLTGEGPRVHHFTDGDPFAEMLRQHEHIQQLINEVCNGTRGPSGTDNYNLGGLAGIPKYFRDYSTVLTGGLTGNLAVTYLGSYNLSYSVTNGVLDIQIYNSSTIASATHPPYVGYTPFWNKNAVPVINGTKDMIFGPKGMSKTEQYFDFHENLKDRCGCKK